MSRHKKARRTARRRLKAHTLRGEERHSKGRAYQAKRERLGYEFVQNTSKKRRRKKRDENSDSVQTVVA